MTEYILTDTQFENIMQPLIVSILGWDVPSVNKKKDVRVSWAEDGQPAWKITDDIVFLRCFEIDNFYNRERNFTDSYEVSPDEFTRETSYTRVMNMMVIAYGSNSFNNIQLLRDGMYKQEHRNVLSNNKIYFMPDLPAPRRVPEYFEGRWWTRYDMNFVFYMLTVKETSVPAIVSIDVGIYDGDDGELIKQINTEEE